MDFLVTNFAQLEPADLAPLLYESADLKVHDQGHARLVCGQGPAQDGAPLTVFSGYAILDDKVVHHLRRDDRPAPGFDQLVTADGVFSLVECTPDRIRILSDPTGQYALFALRRGNSFAVSNNINLIERVAAQNGLHLGRSPEPLVFTLAVGTNIGAASSLEDVRMLRPLHHFEIGASGRLEEIRHTERRDAYVSTGTYRDDLAAARAHLQAVSRDILGLGFDKVAVDLTGGVDSRLVLSALMSVAGTDGFEVLNIARPPNPDRLVADYLVDKYRLRPARLAEAGMTGPDAMSGGRRGQFRYAGMRLKDWPDVHSLRDTNIARVSGAYGEMLYGYAGVGSVRALARSGPKAYAETLVEGRGFGTSMLRRESYEFVKESIAALAADIAASGVPINQVDEVFYCENRSRNHFGFAYRFNNDVRVHIPPLNSLKFSRCTTHLDGLDIRRRRVTFDLMVDLMGLDFTLEPLAQDKWRADFLPRNRRAAYEAVPRVKIDTPPMAPPAPFEWGRPARGGGQAQGGPNHDRPASLRGLSPRFANILSYQRLGTEMVERIGDNDPLWDHLDRDKITAALRSTPEELFSANVEKPRSYAGNMANLAHGLTWYAREELADGTGRDQ